jgi:hypothetical protein
MSESAHSRVEIPVDADYPWADDDTWWQQQDDDCCRRQSEELNPKGNDMAQIPDNTSFDALVPSDSKYLKKEDVGEDGMILTIKGFSREMLEADGVSEEKTIMHFVEDVKPMVLNRTNSQLLPIITGAKLSGEAKGKKVVVYNDPTVGYGGKITGGLRLKKVAGQPKAAPKAKDEPDDEVPF